MRLKVRLFAGLRERAGAAALEVELPDEACAGELLDELAWLIAGISVVVAVDGEYAGRAVALREGAEVALIPPVSGGSADSDPTAAKGPPRGDPPVAEGSAGDGMVWVDLMHGPIDQAELLARVTDPRAGAVVTFHGVTREVPALEYEAYAEMALTKLRSVAGAAHAAHELCRVAVAHRVGIVALSEASVVIAVSAPHRAAAFAGARQIIDELKAQVPIWKREEGEWVRGMTPRTP